MNEYLKAYLEGLKNTGKIVLYLLLLVLPFAICVFVALGIFEILQFLFGWNYYTKIIGIDLETLLLTIIGLLCLPLYFPIIQFIVKDIKKRIKELKG